MDLLYLTTVGAKSGQKRQSTVARFPDGEDAWLVVASAGGSAHHRAWYHNIAAHPDQVWIEFGGRSLQVTPLNSTGARAQAWQRITHSSLATPNSRRSTRLSGQLLSWPSGLTYQRATLNACLPIISLEFANGQ
jgi:deazaflavin-dependent oxidoreductase (nitroreductase family)